MENNQQNNRPESESQRSTSNSENLQTAQPLSKPGEEVMQDQFAETGNTGEHHSESSKPVGENETLGTP